MTVVTFVETSLFDTGQAALLLPGLTAALLHLRYDLAGTSGFSAKRRAMSYALADLTHNWPAVVSGSNRFHTPTDIANEIGIFLDTDFGPTGQSEAHLRAALDSVRYELSTFRKRL